MNLNQTGEFLFTRDLADARTPALEVKRLEERQRHVEEGIICALSMLLDLKELDTGLHATRLAAWAVRVAERMGLPEKELQAVETASVLHDVGKIGVSNEIGSLATFRTRRTFSGDITRRSASSSWVGWRPISCSIW